jgi:hypothetical protein
MRPHPQHHDEVLLRDDLVDEATLDVQSPGAGANQITHDLFVERRILERVLRKDGQQLLVLGLQPRRGGGGR